MRQAAAAWARGLALLLALSAGFAGELRAATLRVPPNVRYE